MDLVGVSEIAEMLGVSRHHVHRLARHADFPDPVATLKVGRIWLATDIEKWERTHRRPRGRPEKPYPP